MINQNFTNQSGIYLILFFLFIIQACAPIHSVDVSDPKADTNLVTSGGLFSHAEWVDQNFQMRMDEEFDNSQKILLTEDLYRLLDTQLDASSNRYFVHAFEGNNVSAIVRYLNKRILYVIPKSANTSNRLKSSSLNSILLEANQNTFVVASNIGTSLWWQKEAQNESLTFTFGDRDIPILSSRVGIIQLGEGYSEKIHQQRRISTLIHEARHSDCTGGLNPVDLELVSKGGVPENHCGHSHVLCPEESDYANLYACDGHLWGAYGIEYLYHRALDQNCKNCDEETRQIARISANDTYLRILNRQDINNQQAPLPNMSSDGVNNR